MGALIISTWVFIIIIFYYSWNKENEKDRIVRERQNRRANSNKAEDYHSKAQKYSENKENLLAISFYDKAIELKPQDNYYNNRGVVKHRINDISGAISDYTKAIIISPAATYYSNRASCKKNIKDFEGAISDYSNAIALKSEAEYYHLRGICKKNLNDIKGAIEDYSKAIEIKPKAEYYSDRASCRSHSGDYQGAINDYSEAIEMEPKDLYYNNRGYNKLKNEDNDGAIEDYTKAIECTPNNKTYYKNRGLSYIKKNYKALACSDFKIASEAGSKEATEFLEYFECPRSELKLNSKKGLTKRNLNKINYLDVYHPYRQGTNPRFNSFSRSILNLKEEEDNNIRDFYTRCLTFLEDDFDTIVTVPSYNPLKNHSGIRSLAEKLAARKGWTDGTACLKRTRKIAKLASGGDRSLDVHLTSISITEINKIRGKKVLLIDDVTTSGNSLYASQKILRDAGATSVYMFALGKTPND